MEKQIVTTITIPLATAAALCLSVSAAVAQQPAPGWHPTGEWQCGSRVRIITSHDGGDGINFEVIGAWFNNNYTFRRGQLFYNGMPCLAIGQPIGSGMPRRARVPTEPEDDTK